MSSKQEQQSVSNQEKIQLLKEKIKKVDSIPPKSPTNSRSVLQAFNNPLEETSQIRPKMFQRTPNPNEGSLGVELRYNEIQQKLRNRIDNQYRVIGSIEMQINSLQEEVKISKKEVDRSRDYIEERASSIEKQVTQEVLEQTDEIKSVRKEMVDSIEKKYKTIKTETMTVLGNHFESGWEEVRQQLSSKIDDLKSALDLEQNARDEAVNFMVNSFGDQILKLEQQVQKEREQREECHKKIVFSLQKMEEDITTLIYQEKKETGTSISHLQNFLEELCFKIQNHLLS